MATWIDRLRLKSRSQDVWTFLKVFAKQPIVATRKLPDWDLETTALLVFYTSAGSAVLSGLLMQGMLALFSSVILVPIMTFIGLALATAFYHYMFIFLYDRTIDPKKIFQVLAVATIPFMVLRVFGIWIGPIVMIGLAITCALLIVGFVDNFYLPKRGVMKLIGLIFALFFCQWIYSTIRSTSRMTDYRDRISNDSLKVLDAEFSDMKKDSE